MARVALRSGRSAILDSAAGGTRLADARYLLRSKAAAPERRNDSTGASALTWRPDPPARTVCCRRGAAGSVVASVEHADGRVLGRRAWRSFRKARDLQFRSGFGVRERTLHACATGS